MEPNRYIGRFLPWGEPVSLTSVGARKHPPQIEIAAGALRGSEVIVSEEPVVLKSEHEYCMFMTMMRANAEKLGWAEGE